MKVRTRLLLGFGSIIIILWAVMLVAATNIGGQSGQINEVRTNVLPGLAAASEAATAVTAAYDTTLAALNPAAPSSMDEARTALANLAAYGSGDKAAGLAVIDADGSLRAEITRFGQSLSDLLELSTTNGLLPPATGEPPPGPPPAFQAATSLYESLQLRTSAIENRYLDELRNNAARFSGTFSTGILMLFGSGVFLTLVGVGSAFLTHRAVVRPLAALREGTERIAAGDLNHRVGTEAGDEIGELSRSFDRLTRNLVASTASVESLYKEITTRQQAEAALRESEEKLRTLLELGTDGYVTIDLKGRVTSCNEAFAAIIGTTESEATGKDLAKLREINVPQLKKLYRVVMTGKPGGPVEVSWQHADGREITAEFRAGPLHVENAIAGVEATVTDITARKKVEQQLKESEERLRSYFEHAPDGIVLSRLNGSVLYCNNKAEEITGYHRNELIGRTLFDINLFPEPYRPKALLGLIRTGAGKPAGPDDLQIRRKDGNLTWVAMTSAPVQHEDQSVMLTFVRDVSERRREEEILRQEREKAQHYLDVAGTMLLALDTGGRVTLLNRKGAEILGYAEDAAAGRDWFETFIPADLRDQIRGVFGRLMKGAEQQERYAVHRVLTASGEERQISWYNTIIRDDHGHITGTLSSGEDVTERLRAEKALRISDAALKSMHDAIIVMDKDFCVIEWTSVCEEMFGVAQEDIVGKFSGDYLVMLEDYPGQNEERARILEERGYNQEEQRYRTPKGDLWVDVHVQAIEEHGERTGWVTLIMDISERKEAEEKLRQLDEMKQEFLSNVSHELRTPLQSIGGFTKLLLGGEVPEPERQAQFLGIIEGETARLEHLINGLLDLSRLETGKFNINRRTVAINDIIKDSVAVLRSLAANKNFKVTLKLGGKMPSIEADPDRLHQVLLNLLGNAIKFSPPGSEVTVRTAKNGTKLTVEVLDEGPGIAAADRAHLFERFYRGEGEKAEGGSGLGLYISRQIIEAHGGTIRAANRPGGGSAFSFTLPLTNKGGE